MKAVSAMGSMACTGRAAVRAKSARFIVLPLQCCMDGHASVDIIQLSRQFASVVFGENGVEPHCHEQPGCWPQYCDGMLEQGKGVPPHDCVLQPVTMLQYIRLTSAQAAKGVHLLASKRQK